MIYEVHVQNKWTVSSQRDQYTTTNCHGNTTILNDLWSTSTEQMNCLITQLVMKHLKQKKTAYFSCVQETDINKNILIKNSKKI